MIVVVSGQKAPRKRESTTIQMYNNQSRLFENHQTGPTFYIQKFLFKFPYYKKPSQVELLR